MNRLRIAIVDSGISPGHPHVGEISGGVSLTGTPDLIDRLGHGTAVAAAIHQWAPQASLYVVKVFDRRLSATIDALIQALEWCRDEYMDLVNLSLGTANPAHRERFLPFVGPQPLIFSPAGTLPGSLPGLIGVDADRDCPRDTYRHASGIFYASPYPRPIPGVPVERNLQGVSFAVANLTGLAAAAHATSLDALMRNVTA
jgi:Subtilase family